MIRVREGKALPFFKPLGIGRVGWGFICRAYRPESVLCSLRHDCVRVGASAPTVWRGPCLVRPHTAWSAGGAAACVIPTKQPSCVPFAVSLCTSLQFGKAGGETWIGCLGEPLLSNCRFLVSGMVSLGLSPQDK